MSVGPINPYNEFDDKENAGSYPQVNAKQLKNRDLRKVNSMIAAIFEKSPSPSRNLRSMDSNLSSPNWDEKCSQLKASVAALQRDLALRSKNSKNLTDDELTYYRSLLSEATELPVNYQRDFFMFVFKLFEVSLIEYAIRFWSGLAKSENNFGHIAKILLMPATGLVKACLSSRENEKYARCDFKPIQLVRDLLKYVDYDFLNMLVVLWGKSKPTRAIALQMVKYYLKSKNVVADDIEDDVRRKLIEFVCRGLSDRDKVITKQAKSLFMLLEKRIPSLASVIRKKSKSHLLPRQSSNKSYRGSSFRSISREILPKTPEIKFSDDVEKEVPHVVRSPAEQLELDFHRELDCVEARINEITKIQKMLSESPQVPSQDDEETPSKLDLDDLAAKLRRANKREAVRKRLQQVETAASEVGGKALRVRKSTAPIIRDDTSTPSVEEEISMSEGEDGGILDDLVQELQEANKIQHSEEAQTESTKSYGCLQTFSRFVSFFLLLPLFLILSSILFPTTPSNISHPRMIPQPMCRVRQPLQSQRYSTDFTNLINSNTIFQQAENQRAVQVFRKSFSRFSSGRCDVMPEHATIPYPEEIAEDEESALMIPELPPSVWSKVFILVNRVLNFA